MRKPQLKIVPHSADIERVSRLPRRDWHVGAEELAVRVTDALRLNRACACCGGWREHYRVPAALGDPNAIVHPDGTRPCKFRRIPLSLYPHQAVAIVEAVLNSGALFPIGVGRGKTLISFLLVTAFASVRPLLLLQAGLIEKAKRNLAELSQYWQIPNWIKMLSYSVLGRVSGKEELVRYQPDLIVGDEIHAIKSRKARVTKVIERYVMHHHTHRLPHSLPAGHMPQLPYHGNPLPTPADFRIAETDGSAAHEHKQCDLCRARIQPKGFGPYGLRVVGMSGTITTQTPKDFSHIAHMCLPGGAAPVPSTYAELERWHYALAVLTNPLSRWDAGALLTFCDARDNALDPEQAVRVGYSRRILETPGIVGTTEPGVKASLQITEWIPPASAAIDDAFARLRGDERRAQVQWDASAIVSGKPTIIGDPAYIGWRLPDGYELVDGIEIYRHACELALGFYRRWREPPPKYWLEARRYWKRFARGVVRIGKLDSDFEVAMLVHSLPPRTIDEMRNEEGLQPHEDPRIGSAHPYDHWVRVREYYDLVSEAVWICDSVVNDCATWLDSNPRGILWVDQVPFGQRLSEVSGRPYFQNKGRDASGAYIDDANGSIIASLDSNKTGRDLQFKWDTNRFTCPLSDGAEAQQVLARTHRDGTDADVITAELIMGCIEHASAFETAKNRARYIEDMFQEKQRLNFADVLVRDPYVLQTEQGTGEHTFRWNKR